MLIPPPLAAVEGVVLLVARVILGVVMVYYGWPKVRDPKKNADDFAHGVGARPGWLWGTLVLVTEFFGGLGMIAGFLTAVAAAAFALEMLLGFAWKLGTGKPFTDYSYDLQLFALCLLVLATGPGPLSLDALL